MSGLLLAMKDFGEEDHVVVRRILSWFNSRYGGTTHQLPLAAIASREESGVPEARAQFEEAADLYDAVEPSTECEKAITVGYWLQVIQKKSGFSGQEVNTLLKHMGNGIGNITLAFNGAKERKPALVMQVQKSGNSKQARKIYKLTISGVRWVETRISGIREDSDQENGHADS